jgi:hypothetical protein
VQLYPAQLAQPTGHGDGDALGLMDVDGDNDVLAVAVNDRLLVRERDVVAEDVNDGEVVAVTDDVDDSDKEAVGDGENVVLLVVEPVDDTDSVGVGDGVGVRVGVGDGLGVT